MFHKTNSCKALHIQQRSTKCHCTSEFQVYLLIRTTDCSPPFALNGSKNLFVICKQELISLYQYAKCPITFIFDTLLWVKHIMQLSFCILILYIINNEWRHLVSLHPSHIRKLFIGYYQMVFLSEIKHDS